MKISDVMTKNPITAKLDSSVSEVALIMNDSRLHAVPVVDDNDCVVGIITESDFFIKGSLNMYLPSLIELLRKNIESVSSERTEKIGNLLSAKARDVMTSPCFCLESGDEIDSFFELIKSKNLHSVPVIDTESKKIVGIITLADIINLIKI